MKDIIIQNFNQVTDNRCKCDVKHKLTDVLVLIMRAVLCGIDTISEIVEYGKQKQYLLYAKFGIEKIPSELTVFRILNMINADIIAVCYRKMLRKR